MLPWASYQIRKNCGLRMRRECQERFSRHRLQRKPLVSDPGMHHRTCVTHVPWCMSGSLTRGGGENMFVDMFVKPVPELMLNDVVWSTKMYPKSSKKDKKYENTSHYVHPLSTIVGIIRTLFYWGPLYALKDSLTKLKSSKYLSTIIFRSRVVTSFCTMSILRC